ncbi:hypothetical protein J4464_02110 [Candidatus Woesearchaeota archaeon]|nr:hypothetical protein [Candidatus Woesearchaeota archaeon]MBS3142160.1 hypothetical protein [Candidatus Woesearchaeota archaeon]
MPHMHFLSQKEIKAILQLLEQQFGYHEKLPYVFARSEKNKVYIINEDIKNLDINHIRMNSVGMYFGEILEDGIRLSIEGSQMIGPHAQLNITLLDDREMQEWLRGEDIPNHFGLRGYTLIRHKGDFLGCGKATENKILNYVPKTRRIRSHLEEPV